MLIGNTRQKSSLETIRGVKRVLHEALDLSDDATITLSELACLEEGCPPIETMFGLLRADAPQLQHKIHKSADDIDADDLTQVCKAWGFDVQITASLHS